MRHIPALLVSLALFSGMASAAGTTSAPNMADIKVMVNGGNYAGAIAALTKLANSAPTADVYNMLGFSNRKLGKLNQAAGFYNKALSLNPNHKGALEYQGEMFVMMKNVAGAKANLAKLKKLCSSGCEQADDLAKAIATM